MTWNTALVAMHLSSPASPDPAELRALAEYEIRAAPKPPFPAWAKVVVTNKAHFYDVVLLTTGPVPQRVGYKPTYSLQNPQEVSFIELLQNPSVRPDLELHADVSEALADVYRWDFIYSLCKFLEPSAMPFVANGSDILILRQCTYMGKQRCCSDFDPEPWDDFVRGLHNNNSIIIV